MEIKGGTTLKLSIDYKAIFKDRVVIITGVGRSGTSILGKLLGSMQPSYYLYEPAILKLIPGDDEHSGKALRAILFEDYFLPLAQGRNVNFNTFDDSFIGHYIANPISALAIRWNKYPRRPDAIKLLQAEKGLFIIKMTEFALWDLPGDTFLGARVINIIRNGNEVINSSMAHGWFTDDYQSIDWVTDLGVPWFISEDDRKEWPAWNPSTRAACVWRSCILTGEDSVIEIRYENLLEQPTDYVMQFNKEFALTDTELTDKHIADIKSHKPKEYPSVLEHIQEPERAKYMSLMEELGYKP